MTEANRSSAELLEDGIRNECVHLLRQSLDKIDHCVRQLNEAQVWSRPRPEMNSVGNLMLHLCGNLQQWVVDGVPALPNAREREAEFQTVGGIPAEELLSRLKQVVDAAEKSIRAVPTNEWLQAREIQEFDVTVLGAIMHSVPHFVGHTHQIVMLTRLALGEEYELHWRPQNDRSSVPI